MGRTLARPEPRRRLSWPDGAPPVGIHLGVAGGLLKAARRARQIGATALQIFSDNPTAWRRRPEPPADAAGFVAYAAANGIEPISIHASYLINLAGSAEPFASQSRAGLIHEMQRAPAYGARLVNTHIGSKIEELAEILERTDPSLADRLAFCLDTAHLWGAGYDISTPEGGTAVLDRFEALIGMDRLRLVHLNDSRAEQGSRNDRHEHVGAGRIGPVGLGAILRDPRLPAQTAVMLETPGVDEGYDAVNLRRALLLYRGAQLLPELPPKAFKLTRRSTRSGPGRGTRGRGPGAGTGTGTPVSPSG
ncbi:MAG TPA: TIM barrel protein [Candidatus Limnocylindria bacterium]